MFQSLGEYVKAKEYLEKALAIKKEIGDRKGEATDYVFESLGEYVAVLLFVCIFYLKMTVMLTAVHVM